MSITQRFYLPDDMSARALGAGAVLDALLVEMPEAQVTRTGSRGLTWLEPLLEVDTPEGRVGFGPLGAVDVPQVLDALATGAPHPKGLGLIEKLPAMAAQTRFTFRRSGMIDPVCIKAYRSQGGFEGYARAKSMGQAAVLEAITASGLRGRGGAGFPTGIKWQTVAAADAPQKYIVANADEGDSGTFADRLLMEGDPFSLIEGMMIAGFAVGASKGLIYLRSEYPVSEEKLTAALEAAYEAGILGQVFDIELRIGAGAYVCGEETSLLNSLEGKRGVVRAKPPLPALEGFMGQPTVVNNVITLAAVPEIVRRGPEAYAALGAGRSAGTIPIQIAGNAKFPGLFEVPFGLSLAEVVHGLGGGTATGRPVKAVQVGGPLGAYFPPALFDTPFTYEDFTAAQGLIGHAGVVVFDESADMLEQARFAMEFCAVESCGKCTPCRIGSARGVEVIDRLRGGDAGALPVLTDLLEVMELGSLCALGGFTPYPVRSALTHFPQDFKLPEGAL